MFKVELCKIFLLMIRCNSWWQTIFSILGGGFSKSWICRPLPWAGAAVAFGRLGRGHLLRLGDGPGALAETRPWSWPPRSCWRYRSSSLLDGRIRPSLLRTRCFGSGADRGDIGGDRGGCTAGVRGRGAGGRLGGGQLGAGVLREKGAIQNVHLVLLKFLKFTKNCNSTY